MFFWHNHSNRGLIFVSLVLASVVIAACTKSKQTSKLYNIDSLLTQQVKALTLSKPKLEKHAILGNTTEKQEYVPDSAAWSRELDIFRQLEAINKPVNRSNYLVDDNLYDPGSNLTVKAFTALEPLPVRSLRVFYENDIQTPRKIEAVYDEENTLYKSSKNLLLEFQQINNKNVLTSYSIDGGQRMILSDSVTFSVKGRIQF